MMFKSYKDICDVVSLLVYCPSERSFLVTKENNGEFWIPCSPCEKNNWKLTAHKIHFEILGMDTSSDCHPLRIYKIWVPNSSRQCVYHAVYKVSIKTDVKKRAKLRAGNRSRLQWLTSVELERQRAHAMLRSPELMLFSQMAVGDTHKDNEMESGMIVEICEENVLVECEVAGGAVAVSSPHCHILQAANYTTDDQVRLYSQFLPLVFPAMYMSPGVFTQFMVDVGWQRSHCFSLFRAADISNRGGLSFMETLLWTAALEPNTNHEGVTAETRCRYIFRYFDGNRDSKLEYLELKELIAAGRTASGLTADSLSVSRDADLCLRQLGLTSAAPLGLAEFLRWSSASWPAAGTLLRAPVSRAHRLRDLQERFLAPPTDSKTSLEEDDKSMRIEDFPAGVSSGVGVGAGAGGRFALATCTVHLRTKAAPEIQHIRTFDENTVSASTAKLVSLCANSMERLGDNAVPSKAFAAVHYFANPIEKPVNIVLKFQMMFKSYKDICDVVSLLVYCPSERSFLVTKENNGEFWIPCSPCEKNNWKLTAHKIHFEILGMDTSSDCHPLRIYKIWVPNSSRQCVYHAVYKVSIKTDVKKRAKLRAGNRSRLQWLTSVELERQRAHAMLRSPELMLFSQLAVGDAHKDNEMESGMIVEICEENVLVECEVAGGAVAVSSPHCHILQAANYTTDDQVRLYREFLPLVFPALYMSPGVFTQFMVDVGWQRSHWLSLFRAADISNRGGLSFMETLLWTAALEPNTNHEGVTAVTRCRYIFRYFDGNRDSKLEYLELKELIAAGRTASGLTADSLSVSRDADLCLRQLGLTSAAPLGLAEFLRWSSASWPAAGTLLRAPVSRAHRLRDLQERFLAPPTDSKTSLEEDDKSMRIEDSPAGVSSGVGVGVGVGAGAGGRFALATCTVHLRPKAVPEIQHIRTFDENTVSASTAKLVSLCANSMERLGDNAVPSEAFAAVHYFANPIEKPVNRRMSERTSMSVSKAAYSWLQDSECASLGATLLRLAEAVRPLCLHQPRLLTISSPVYVIGDLHGNLAALLAIEALLWPNGMALMPANLLFLGDYVDRGPHGTELMAYLFAAKLQRPDSIHLIRGNHETREIQKMFTFYMECMEKYGEVEGSRVWNAVNDVFDVLPLAAIVDEKVFCCHGGIPPPWVCPLATGVNRVPVPLPRPEQSALAWELMWNDPVDETSAPAEVVLELSASEGFARNWRRGVGHVFNAGALRHFLRHNRLDAVLRAHQLHAHGFMLQAGGRLVSLFSSSHYCGGSNESAVALLQRHEMRLLRVDD